jgi:DNA-binding HxlR family transcriptional regulator
MLALKQEYIFYTASFGKLEYGQRCYTLRMEKGQKHGRDSNGETAGDQTFCPVYAAIDLLQEKWTLHIIRSLLEGSKGFNELRREVGGCNPSTLSERLETLVTHGILRKTVHSTMPPRTSYDLTPAGVAMQDVIRAIDTWSRAHLSGPREPGPREPGPQEPGPDELERSLQTA